MDADVWDEAQNPERMIRALGNNLDYRKLQLFGVASCRRVWDWITSERLEQLRGTCEPLGLAIVWPPLWPSPCHLAVEAAERYAEGQCDAQEWEAAGKYCGLIWTEAAAYYEDYCDQSPSFDREMRVVGRAVRAAHFAGVAHPMHAAETARSVAYVMAYQQSTGRRPDMDAFDAEFAAQARLLRSIYGNPFRDG